MESQRKDVTTAADGEKVDLNLLRPSPEQLVLLEIVRDSAVMRRNEYFVSIKPADIVVEEHLTDCNEQVPTATQVQTPCSQSLTDEARILSSRRVTSSC
ncbi:unnamed protein product [Macrosiphum euphorbiae]|uniref:Uncharacterized protein n=1 Tax=Macrosiphum euphorbiae TaxID=13131 RepID=A0AAV0VWK4_9HEMI|nr:unnamed protein product [Macrosiphum euphorbiae]